jgi:hypothetical protein
MAVAEGVGAGLGGSDGVVVEHGVGEGHGEGDVGIAPRAGGEEGADALEVVRLEFEGVAEILEAGPAAGGTFLEDAASEVGDADGGAGAEEVEEAAEVGGDGGALEAVVDVEGALEVADADAVEFVGVQEGGVADLVAVEADDAGIGDGPGGVADEEALFEAGAEEGEGRMDAALGGEAGADAVEVGPRRGAFDAGESGEGDGKGGKEGEDREAEDQDDPAGAPSEVPHPRRSGSRGPSVDRKSERSTDFGARAGSTTRAGRG